MKWLSKATKQGPDKYSQLKITLTIKIQTYDKQMFKTGKSKIHYFDLISSKNID